MVHAELDHERAASVLSAMMKSELLASPARFAIDTGGWSDAGESLCSKFPPLGSAVKEGGTSLIRGSSLKGALALFPMPSKQEPNCAGDLVYVKTAATYQFPRVAGRTNPPRREILLENPEKLPSSSAARGCPGFKSARGFKQSLPQPGSPTQLELRALSLLLMGTDACNEADAADAEGDCEVDNGDMDSSASDPDADAGDTVFRDVAAGAVAVDEVTRSPCAQAVFLGYGSHVHTDISCHGPPWQAARIDRSVSFPPHDGRSIGMVASGNWRSVARLGGLTLADVRRWPYPVCRGCGELSPLCCPDHCAEDEYESAPLA